MNKPPFDIEDYKPTSGSLYQYTLRDTKTGEAIAPLTSDQGLNMKLLLQLWCVEERTINVPVGTRGIEQ